MKLSGAMTALVTPMKDGGIDTESLHRLIEHQLDGGIDALVAAGTTGESATLTAAEHALVVAETVRAAAGRVPVIAGAGSNDTARAIEASKMCTGAGADALLHVVPYYNKPTQDSLVAHFEAIADAAERPVILYNVPGRTVTDMTAATVLRLAAHPNIAGIKEATGNMVRASEILEACPGDFAVLSGDDFTSYSLYALGGHGVISVISNVMPVAMAQMWDAASAGDLARARELHYQIQPLLRLLFAEPNPVPTKAALTMLGICGPELRLPLLPVTAGLKSALEAQMRRDGLL